jgi:hypothetical protein
MAEMQRKIEEMQQQSMVMQNNFKDSERRLTEEVRRLQQRWTATGKTLAALKNPRQNNAGKARSAFNHQGFQADDFRGQQASAAVRQTMLRNNNSN